MTDLAMPKMDRGGLLVDRAYDALQRAILEQRILPGTALSVPKLAEQLGISRSPVREAVLRLTGAGLAENIPHKGAVVAAINPGDSLDLFEVREPLEGVAARRAAERADAAAIRRLTDILEAHEQLVDTGDIASHVEFDIAFHKAIRDIAGNPELTTALDRIQLRAHLALNTLWGGQGTSRRSLDFHRAILGAIAAGDGDLAERAARDHIAEVRSRIAEAFDDNAKEQANA